MPILQQEQAYLSARTSPSDKETARMMRIASASLSVLVVWGASHTASFVIGHVRTMFAAPNAAAFAGSLNISVSNLGVAAGAVAGGYVVDHHGVAAIGYGGAVFAGIAICIALVMQMAASRSHVGTAIG